MASVPSKVLPRPKIHGIRPLAHLRLENPTAPPGTFGIPQFHTPSPQRLTSYSLVILDAEMSDELVDVAVRFVGDLVGVCGDMGMRVVKRDVGRVVVRRERGWDVERCLVLGNSLGIEAALEGRRGGGVPGNTQMIFCVLGPEKGLYNTVKTLSETKLNLMTQCIHSKTLANLRPISTTSLDYKRVHLAALRTLAMKVNVKLGGVNKVVEGGVGVGRGTLVVGAHLEVGDRKGGVRDLGVGAVVGAVDGSTFRSSIKTQPPGMAFLGFLGQSISDILTQLSSSLPPRIIIFRHGVSDSSMHDIGAAEVESVRDAVREMGGQVGKVGITFVVVNRVRTGKLRFFEGEENPEPGTVVDSVITRPGPGKDFYLIPHSALNGSPRPIHYSVILDENQFSSDEIKAMVYRMCFLSATSTEPTCLAVPVRYAQKLAKRAFRYRQVLGPERPAGVEDVEEFVEEVPEIQGVRSGVASSMFFL
ncbi:Eukaryotic translation initiation factor 2C [Dinochytrium kinnereticum]|nr:Eukaryotic translation initiation factor 2C [Dinochytrium kinnereticum]